MITTQCPYPGSRWWKFDFHTHTPASSDWCKNSSSCPEQWLLQYMNAQIDCVAITDHNSGAWIDKLKNTYTKMEEKLPDGFRELTLFPGVEISVNGGIHILAIFDSNATTSHIDTLLGAVDYKGTQGHSDRVTNKSVTEVIKCIASAGAIAIPAHADASKGLFQLDATTLKQTLAIESLFAVEWSSDWPSCIAAEKNRFARVLGSDCHGFKGQNIPGSRYTWVKMARPNLEGLRIALLDGNRFAICPVGKGEKDTFNPLQFPKHWITSIEINNARYMGQGEKPAQVNCSPFFNAIVGGRGTGKSTLVHALRLALRREGELNALAQHSDLKQHFDAFCKSAQSRDDKGALRKDSEICVQWQYEDIRLKLLWDHNGLKDAVQEQKNGEWIPSPSQKIHATRFPIRIFSQGQIAALASNSRQGLLSIIDEAADIHPLQQKFKEAQNTFYTQNARLRELSSKLSEQDELQRRLDEVNKKLKTLEQTNHATLLRAYTLAQYQTKEVEALLQQIHDKAQSITNLAEQISLEDWPKQYFTDSESDLLSWRKAIDQQVHHVYIDLLAQAKKLHELKEQMPEDTRFTQWYARIQENKQKYTELQQELAAQGVAKPQAFAYLTQDKQQLEGQIKTFQTMQNDRKALEKQIKDQQKLMLQRRQDITQARKKFLEKIITNNPHVRIQVHDFGFDPEQIELELRELLGVPDERFADDILLRESGEAKSGMAWELASENKDNIITSIDSLKQKLLKPGNRFSGYFRNYLQKQHKNSDFADRILAWFPGDDLNIEYLHGDKWKHISQGSQGQRSAALLAFLLAFGKEPIILDQPEDDLDNQLIYDLIVQQIRENKQRRQLIVITHNPNIVVNGDADLIHIMAFKKGQCVVQQSGTLQELKIREAICRVMEGGYQAFKHRWRRLSSEIKDVAHPQ